MLRGSLFALSLLTAFIAPAYATGLQAEQIVEVATVSVDENGQEQVTYTLAEEVAPGTGFDDDPDVAGAGPILSAPTTPAASDCNGTTTCVIQLSDALLPAGRTGTITIRALVK